MLNKTHTRQWQKTQTTVSMSMSKSMSMSRKHGTVYPWALAAVAWLSVHCGGGNMNQDVPFIDLGAEITDAQSGDVMVNPDAMALRGGWLVFTSRRAGNYDIYVTRDDGTETRAITTDPGTDLYPSFSPDGTTIAFASNRSGTFAVYTYSLDTSQTQALNTRLNWTSTPVYSPDGQWIAVEGRENEGANGDIFLIPVRGGLPRQLTTVSAKDGGPVFSHDGNTVFFITERRGGPELWAVDTAGGNERPIGIPGILGRVSVAPDGSQLAYALPDNTGQVFVWLYDLATARSTILTAPEEGASEPCFAPTGSRFAVTSVRFGIPEIVILPVMGANTATPVRVTNDPAIDGQCMFAPP